MFVTISSLRYFLWCHPNVRSCSFKSDQILIIDLVHIQDCSLNWQRTTNRHNQLCVTNFPDYGLVGVWNLWASALRHTDATWMVVLLQSRCIPHVLGQTHMHWLHCLLCHAWSGDWLRSLRVCIQENAMKFGPIDNKSTLPQVMAWRVAIPWTYNDPVHWHIHAAPGWGDEF